ncbi:AI-2E family transporter [soil metagenome]
MTRKAIPGWLLAVLCVGAAAVAVPFAPWIVLAVWLALFAERLYQPLERRLKGRSSLAATITLLLMLAVLVPVAALTASVVLDAVDLVQHLLKSDQGKSVLEQIAGGGGDESTRHDWRSVQGIIELTRQQGERAWGILRHVAGVAAHAVIGLLILVSGIYGLLVEGKSWYAWLEQHAPMSPATLKRFAGAFVETGRGMAWGVVGAGALQSIVATVTYFALGVPSALALGMLTLIFSVIPAVGTAIVWAPVAAGLALSGRPGAAIVLGGVGMFVIGSVDNLARPILAKRGNLALPSYVVLIAMFGGIELLGGWGLILGPLVVRLAKEAILIRTERVITTDPA